MIWFFTRGSAQVDIEVRRVPDADLFELVIDYPDGSEGVERFRSPKKLIQRTLAVQRHLIRKGWTPTSPGHHPRAHVPAPAPRIGRRRALRAMPGVWAYVQKRVRERLAATFGF
jgi:hypothetical protein